MLPPEGEEFQNRLNRELEVWTLHGSLMTLHGSLIKLEVIKLEIKSINHVPLICFNVFLQNKLDKN